MPQRFLRPGLTTSARFNAADWQAQSLYVRLITLVDDYGRFESHPMLLKSLAFPFNPEITCEQMLALCEQLQTNDLAVFYEVDGKSYLQLARWQEKARSHSKFPEFRGDACKQLLANVSKCSAPSSSPSSSPSPSSISSKPQPPAADCVMVYETYPKKVGRAAALKAIAKALRTTPLGQLLAATKAYAAARAGEDQQFTPHPATWFNRQSYLDDQSTWKNYATDKQNPRNLGVAKAGPSSGDAAKRKLAQQSVAGQVAETKPASAPLFSSVGE
jgi:hypothetical protein